MLAVLSGCATKDEWAWNKSGSTQQTFYMEDGQCRAQAFSVAGGALLQVALVYDSCMQGKGWYKVPAGAKVASVTQLASPGSPPGPQTKGCELSKDLQLICP